MLASAKSCTWKPFNWLFGYETFDTIFVANATKWSAWVARSIQSPALNIRLVAVSALVPGAGERNKWVIELLL